MINNKFHFIQLKGNRPFGIHHYLAVKSCKDVNNPESISFYYDIEPTGEWWEKTKPLVTEVKVNPPKEIFDKPLKHLAHKSDVMRLQILIEDGGIYCDTDTLFVKPYSDLLNNNFVLGYQGKDGVEGICPAVIMSEKDSIFAKRWLVGFKRYFYGGDPGSEYWCTHSVNYPLYLASEFKNYVTIVNDEAFFKPLYHQKDLENLFVNDVEFTNAYSFHLWETCSKQYLDKLTPEYIQTVDNTYNKIARKYL